MRDDFKISFNSTETLLNYFELLLARILRDNIVRTEVSRDILLVRYDNARALLGCSRRGLTLHTQDLAARAWEVLVAARLHTLSLMSHGNCQLHAYLSGTTVLTLV